MKWISRILALLLSALLLSCSLAAAEDYAAPMNAADIVGLPAMPDVPAMKTKNDGVTETITLSEELESLSAYWNWGAFPITLEGTTATYDIAENNRKFDCQQGMYTWGKTYDAPWLQVEGEEVRYMPFLQMKSTDPKELDKWKKEAKEWLMDNDPGIVQSRTKDDHAVNGHSDGYIVIDYVAFDEADKEIWDQNAEGMWVAYWTCDKWTEAFGAREMTAYQGYGTNEDGHGFAGAEYAFTGVTKDGVNVMYNRRGDNTARSVIAAGANVFGTETEPEKTEFVWIRFERADGSIGYHLHTVIATYAEGSYETIQAWYSAGGGLRQVHAVPRAE